MSTEVKKHIDELKYVVMEYFRTAADLDKIISSMEVYTGFNTNYDEAYIRSQRLYRETHIKHLYSDIEKREKEIWSNLINVLEKES